MSNTIRTHQRFVPEGECPSQNSSNPCSRALESRRLRRLNPARAPVIGSRTRGTPSRSFSLRAPARKPVPPTGFVFFRAKRPHCRWRVVTLASAPAAIGTTKTVAGPCDVRRMSCHRVPTGRGRNGDGRADDAAPICRSDQSRFSGRWPRRTAVIIAKPIDKIAHTALDRRGGHVADRLHEFRDVGERVRDVPGLHRQ